MYAIELNGLHCGLAISFLDASTKKTKVVVADHIRHTGTGVSLITRTENKRRAYYQAKYRQSTTTLKLDQEVTVHYEGVQ